MRSTLSPAKIINLNLLPSSLSILIVETFIGVGRPTPMQAPTQGYMAD